MLHLCLHLVMGSNLVGVGLPDSLISNESNDNQLQQYKNETGEACTCFCEAGLGGIC